MRIRCADSDKFKEQIPSSASNLVKVAEKKRMSNTKEVCFDLTKRGSIGETLLHLCFLNGTKIHNELAKLLIKHFPKLTNDVYTSEEFYGKIFTW